MAYYDIIAKNYDELHKEEQLNKLYIIKNSIKICKNTKVLDVGCGTGISSRLDCLVVGIDPSIELLKQNKNSQKLLSIAESLPFKNSTFDYVVSVTAIHNFKNIIKSVQEMKRVGRKNFVFSVLQNCREFSIL